ncbi:hypothetical protein PHMEG_00015908 [Phytophthora megakarya]|uniref:Uncharacterized protein n=1 Tax=Phytophthora megakarya TaxID=4795 RepID=A0A225W177_9STRA|nr:hypothetical protein PHMEG_00015908 [Phytophthora megakarya]
MVMVAPQLERYRERLDIPQGTERQETATMKCFSEFLTLGNMNEGSVASVASLWRLQTLYLLICCESAILCICQTSKRIPKIRDKMTAAIDERNMLAGVQTGCTLDDLRGILLVVR